MTGYLSTWWQSLVMVGAPVFPYVGLVLLILLGILVLCVVLYLLYRLAKRLPPLMRYLFWRAATALRRLSALKPGKRLSHRLTAGLAGTHRTFSFDSSFDEQGRWFSRGRRPREPLFVVLGPSKSGKTTLLRAAAGRGATHSLGDEASDNTDVVWWRLKGRYALELRHRLLAPSAQPQRTQLLQDLERFCPERPLDGVIVTLPADFLMETSNETRTELTQLARVVTEFCSVAGHRLPVYVLVNGADRLTGFQEWVQASRGRLPENELHWLDVEPNADTEQILAAWSRSVQTGILRSLVVAPPPGKGAGGNAILALPAQIAQVRSSLLGWLQDVTAPVGSDQAGAVFQGVLLAGLAREGAAAALLGIDSLAPNLAFARSWSAPPSARHVVRARRSAAIALALLVGSVALLAFWTPRTISAISANAEVMRGVARQNGSDFRAAKMRDGAGLATPDAQRLDRLLDAISIVDQRSLGAALAPSSWFDSTQSRLLSQLGHVVQQQLIAPRVVALRSDRSAMAPPTLTPVQASVATRADELPAYTALQEFLGSRELIGSSMETAQSLPGGISYLDLVRFVGDNPTRFRTPEWEWGDALPAAVVQRFSVAGLPANGDANPELKRLVDALWERLLRESLDLHPVLLLTEEIDILLAKLGRGADWTHDDALALRNHLLRLKQEMERPSAQHLLGKMPDALRFINPALARLANSSIVSLPQRADASVQFNHRREAMRSRLLAYEAAGVGPLFVLDSAEGMLAPSAELKRFSASYMMLMTQPFMQALPHVATYAQLEHPLSWNLVELEAVKELSVAMHDYVSVGSQAFDPGLRSNLIRVARQQFRDAIDGVFLQAARPLERFAGGGPAVESLPALRAQAENFSEASRLYKLTLPYADGAESVAGKLLSRQAVRALSSLQRHLSTDDPYLALSADTQRWIASSAEERSLAAAMRGNPKERLVLTRDFVRTQYGVPAGLLLNSVNGLPVDAAREDVVLHWQRMLEVLEAFDKGASANGLYEFEQYVLNLAKLTSADECFRYLAERAPVSWRSDYFSSRLAQMDEAVAEACGQRHALLQRQRYENFAEWFNRNVSGHPPFLHEPRHAPLSRRGFATALEQYREMRKQLPAEPAGWPRPVTQFLAQMDNLTARFAAPDRAKAAVNGAARAPVSSAVQAKVQFRSNAAQAMMADQIIEWSIHPGSRQHGLRNPDDVFEWHIGEPIEVRLRWASHSPYTPVAAQDGNERYTVKERTAVFRFTGEWSLFDLMHGQGVQGDGFEQSVLRFDVAVVGPQGRATTHAFVTLTAVDSQIPLALDFPGHAPGFSSAAATRGWSLKLDYTLK